jgi:hypothetical protein
MEPSPTAAGWQTPVKAKDTTASPKSRNYTTGTGQCFANPSQTKDSNKRAHAKKKNTKSWPQMRCHNWNSLTKKGEKHKKEENNQKTTENNDQPSSLNRKMSALDQFQF